MKCGETSKGVLITSADIAGIGTVIDFDALFPSGGLKAFNGITVFNDADRPVKASWTNDLTGENENFIVPHGGKSYSHMLHKGNITPGSLVIYSISSATAASGNITINLEGN